MIQYLKSFFSNTTGTIEEAMVDQVKATMVKKGYEFFDKGKYNVNIIGIRRTPKKSFNDFDDTILVVYRDDYEQWRMKSLSATTIPGQEILQRPVNEKGTAILVPGQYKGAYMIGRHKGQYEALVQRMGKVKVWRMKDGEIQKEVDEGYFGINIHKAGIHSLDVDGWSAGCQVFQMKEEFDMFMHVMRRAASIWGNRFTYTLL